MTMNSSLLKAILTLSMFFGSLIVGLMPLALTLFSRRGASLLQRRRITAALSLVNCVGGGVFLGVAFLHLMPEVVEGVSNGLKAVGVDEETRRFPWAQAFIVFGMFLILIIEQSVVQYQENRGLGHGHGHSHAHNHAHKNSHDHNHGHEGHSPLESSQKCLTEDEITPLDKTSQLQPKKPSSSSSRTRIMLRSGMLLLAISIHSLLEGLAFGLQMKRNHIWKLYAALIAHKFMIAFSLGLSLLSLADTNSDDDGGKGGCSNVKNGSEMKDNRNKEGRKDVECDKGDTHDENDNDKNHDRVNLNLRCRCICRFRDLLKQWQQSRPVLLSVTIFAATTPLGAFVGILMTNESVEQTAASNLALGILQALACGTFFYVTFFEILPNELDRPAEAPRGEEEKNGGRKRPWRWMRLFKASAIILGFILFALMEKFSGHHHHHEHGGDSGG